MLEIVPCFFLCEPRWFSH